MDFNISQKIRSVCKELKRRERIPLFVKKFHKE